MLKKSFFISWFSVGVVLFTGFNCMVQEKKEDSKKESLVLVVAASSASNSTSGSSSLSGVALEFQNLVNEHRKSVGCNPLVEHKGLNSLAQKHSEDMKVRNFFSHTNPDGKSPFDRIKEAGISYKSAGENIAKGQSTANQVLNSWLNSSGHKANIENCNYTHHGIGYVGEGIHLWTHKFAQNPNPSN